MRMFTRLLHRSRPHSKTNKEVEARFLRLYSMWHETHDLSLRKRLLVRLGIVMRRVPNFDLRSRFDQAF